MSISNYGGVIDDPAFEKRFEEWSVRTAKERWIWVAEQGGVLVGMINVAIVERMPGRATQLCPG